MNAQRQVIFTIGHSNHELEAFLNLLEQHKINVIADVRSSPYSKYATWFNKNVLSKSLDEINIRYLFLGDVLGGRPEGAEFYDDKGYVLYYHLAQSPKFEEGIERLLNRISNFYVALLCGEEDPTNCHRRLLISRILIERNVDVLHIRGDGSIQSECEVAKNEEFQKTKGQLALFDIKESKPWKSTQSVLPKKQQNNSSEFSSNTE